VDFGAIFSKLTQYDFPGWAVLEWECCIKSSEQGAAEGAPFIQRHIIEAATGSFDDFAGSGADQKANARMLGAAVGERKKRLNTEFTEFKSTEGTEKKRRERLKDLRFERNGGKAYDNW